MLESFKAHKDLSVVRPWINSPQTLFCLFLTFSQSALDVAVHVAMVTLVKEIIDTVKSIIVRLFSLNISFPYARQKLFCLHSLNYFHLKQGTVLLVLQTGCLFALLLFCFSSLSVIIVVVWLPVLWLLFSSRQTHSAAHHSPKCSCMCPKCPIKSLEDKQGLRLTETNQLAYVLIYCLKYISIVFLAQQLLNIIIAADQCQSLLCYVYGCWDFKLYIQHETLIVLHVTSLYKNEIETQ